MPISACARTSNGLSPVAQLFCGNIVASDDQFHRLVFQTLVVALVLSRLDYGNATLVGLPANLLKRLQSVLNAAARSVAGLRRSDHITDTLASFHWLRAPEHIKFKLAVIVYRCIHARHCTSVSA